MKYLDELLAMDLFDGFRAFFKSPMAEYNPFDTLEEFDYSDEEYYGDGNGWELKYEDILVNAIGEFPYWTNEELNRKVNRAFNYFCQSNQLHLVSCFYLQDEVK